MNLYSGNDRYTPDQLELLHDQAKRRAGQLRSEAINDFWQGIAGGWTAQQSRARRAAARLASSLVRHARLRGAASSSAASHGCR